MQKKIKHLEFIQKIIERQARNSFLLKGWVITITTALFAFSKESTLNLVFSVYGLIFIFGILDSYYLWKEKLYRQLYNNVRKLDEEKIDFNMNTDVIAREKKCSWIDSVSSITILSFYVGLMLFTVAVFYLK